MANPNRIMGTQYYNSAIVFGDIKQALLYYDHVIPLGPAFVEIRPDREPTERGGRTGMINFQTHWSNAIISSVVPPDLISNSQFKATADNFSQNLAIFRSLLLINTHLPHDEYVRDILRQIPLDRIFTEFAASFGLADMIVDCPDDFFKQKGETHEETTVDLLRVQIIDVSRTSLEQIVEFRRDEEARRKMRNFRLFVYGNYAGKSAVYVKEDIQRRLEDYHEAVRAWGFETKLKTLSFVLNSRYLSIMLGGSLLTALFGSTTEAIAGAVAGVGIGIGRYALELSKQNHELRKIIRDNPISYIADAKEKLERGKKQF